MIYHGNGNIINPIWLWWRREKKSGETKLIHRVVTEKGKETNRDTLDKAIEECPDETSPVEMEEGVNNEDYDEKETENDYEVVIHRYIT